MRSWHGKNLAYWQYHIQMEVMGTWRRVQEKEKNGTANCMIPPHSVENGEPLSFVQRIVWNAAFVHLWETWQDFRVWRIEIRSAGSFLEELVCFLPVISLLATILCMFIPNFYVLGPFGLNSLQKNPINTSLVWSHFKVLSVHLIKWDLLGLRESFNRILTDLYMKDDHSSQLFSLRFHP